MDLLRHTRPADDRSSLKDDDAKARLREVRRGHETVVTATDDDNILGNHGAMGSRTLDKGIASAYAFFRSGSKKGLSTTVAGARCRSHSTATSISIRVPTWEYGAATVAIAMYFFRSGDQHPLVAQPICR